MIDYDLLHYSAIQTIALDKLNKGTLTHEDPIYLEYMRLQRKVREGASS